MSEYEIINIGTLPNDGEGDPLRVAFGKTNNNFAKLFSTATETSNSYTTSGSANQVIFETSANTFTQALFAIRSKDPGTDDSQAIQIHAQINPAKDAVKFTGYGTTFFGNALASFDMDVLGGNVRLLCSPIGTQPLFHFISSQILFQGEEIPGLEIGLDGYVDSVMTTEAGLPLSTEES